MYAAAANIAVLVTGVVVMGRVGANPFGELPWTFKLFLWLPFLVLLAAVLLLIQATLVWKQRLLSGLWERAAYTAVTASAIGMCWFYVYWNLIGPQYLE